jgi:hypothetical protein
VFIIDPVVLLGEAAGRHFCYRGDNNLCEGNNKNTIQQQHSKALALVLMIHSTNSKTYYYYGVQYHFLLPATRFED